jgi:hypothetical protein
MLRLFHLYTLVESPHVDGPLVAETGETFTAKPRAELTALPRSNARILIRRYRSRNEDWGRMKTYQGRVLI